MKVLILSVLIIAFPGLAWPQTVTLSINISQADADLLTAKANKVSADSGKAVAVKELVAEKLHQYLEDIKRDLGQDIETNLRTKIDKMTVQEKENLLKSLP